ncbi:MAG: c-type cytochrome [Flavobacteriales bacterium]|nr:c-type cytochrome [Flavobacteriales bacterium]
MKTSLLTLGVALAVLSSCGNDSEKKKETVKDPVSSSAKKWAKLSEDANTYFAVLPKESVNPENPSSSAKIALGQALYFDNRLSKNQTQSCNTCHDLQNYGVDSKAVSDGDDGKSKGTRNSPTTLNASFHMSQFWDGRAKDVEEQAGMPVLNPVEMNIPSEKFLIKRLKKVAFYKEMFAAAFPDQKDPITYDNIKNAIGDFERQLITPSKFDKYLAGDTNALNDAEKEGLSTFITQGCTTCHSGAQLGGAMMQKFPIVGNYEDYLSGTVDMGKYEETKKDMDKFMFKVPSLRNIEKTGPYMHNGGVADLGETVKLMAKAELAKDLSAEQVKSIVTFLATLTGELDPKYKTAPAVLSKS